MIDVLRLRLSWCMHLAAPHSGKTPWSACIWCLQVVAVGSHAPGGLAITLPYTC